MSYAGVGRRFVAVSVDGILLFVLALGIAYVTGGTYAERNDSGANAGFTLDGGGALAWILGAFAYYVVSELVFGATIGKLVVGLRVVNGDGEPITLGQALLRNIVRPVDFAFLYLVAAIAVWTSPQRQRLGDRAAATFVVRAA